MTETFDKRDCPLCGAPAGRARPLPYGTAEFRVVQCSACDLVFLDHLPPQHEFADERAWEVSSVSHATQRKRDYPILVAGKAGGVTDRVADRVPDMYRTALPARAGPCTRRVPDMCRTACRPVPGPPHTAAVHFA